MSRLDAWVCEQRCLWWKQDTVVIVMLLRTIVSPSLVSRNLSRHSRILTRTMSITHIQNTRQLDDILAKSKDKTSVSEVIPIGLTHPSSEQEHRPGD